MSLLTRILRSNFIIKSVDIKKGTRLGAFFLNEVRIFKQIKRGGGLPPPNYYF